MTPFDLIDAASAADAAALLAKIGPKAQPIAGGGDLLGLLKEAVEGPTLPTPKALVNLGTAPDMTGIAVKDGRLRIGAMTKLVDLAAHPGTPPMLAQAVARIASPQLRAWTTVGGNLLQRPRCLYFRHPDIVCFKKGGTGCPAVGGPPEAYPGALYPGLCHAGHPSDLAPAFAALAAEVEIVGPSRTRSLPLIDLYQGAGTDPGREAQLGPAEIMAAILVPQDNRAQAFERIAARDANEFAWASAALCIDMKAGRIQQARFALGGIAPAPLLWAEAAPLFIGRRLHDLVADEVAATLHPPARIAAAHPARVAACRTAIRRVIDAIARTGASH